LLAVDAEVDPLALVHLALDAVGRHLARMRAMVSSVEPVSTMT
jgi:hypothetical protein